MDEIDISAEREQLERESLIEAIRRRRGDKVLPEGMCHHCGEMVHGLKLFCDLDCGTAWEKRRRR